MISTDLRIRLEGQVEALEQELGALRLALRAARRHDFGPASQLLLRAAPRLNDRGDQGLRALEDERAGLTLQLERLIASRLSRLGILPSGSPSRDAWALTQETVLYERRGFAPALYPMVFHLPAFVVFAPVMIVQSRLHFLPLTLVVGVGAVTALVKIVSGLFWSDVLLTRRWLHVDGRSYSLEGITRALAERPMYQAKLPFSRIQLRGETGGPIAVRVRHAPNRLLEALEEAGISVERDTIYF
jgi:hypothetical protein